MTVWNVTFKKSIYLFTCTFSHLADTFIQSDLQMRTIEAIKTNKRAIKCKCYNKSWLAQFIVTNLLYLLFMHVFIYLTNNSLITNIWQNIAQNHLQLIFLFFVLKQIFFLIDQYDLKYLYGSKTKRGSLFEVVSNY